MLRFAHFFEGTLRREEVASAFLAMALEGVPSFRQYFFKLILPNEKEALTERDWRIAVEQDRVDVRMQSLDTVFLIENKVSAGAKQQGQLLRYNLEEKKRNLVPRIVAVCVAPGQIGLDEITRLTDSSEFNDSGSDLALHVSWDDIILYPSNTDQPSDCIIRDGLDEIQRVIKENQTVKYVREGDRGLIRDIADQAIILLGDRTTIPLRRWSGKDIEEILTVSTNVTVWLDLVFQIEEEPPFSPLNVSDKDGLFHLTVRSQFKLAGKIKKASALAQWWHQRLMTKTLDVPGVGEHHLEANGWYVHSRLLSGDKETIAALFAETGYAALDTLSSWLSADGFDINAEHAITNDELSST